MCILFFILNENARDDEYKLILASNRDEFYARPAKVAGPWKENEFVIGGRDMEPGREGGTWLAISTKDHTFKFGALLNITGEKKGPDALPRGNIVVDYVQKPITNAQYCQDLIDTDKEYNAFNLITIEIRERIKTIYYCNVNNEAHQSLQNEVLGFGNSLTHQPLQKVIGGREKFRAIVKRQNQSKEELVKSLNELLSDREKHWPDDELHRRAPNWSEHLCSICARVPAAEYGSRTRTIILVDGNNKVDFYEETMATTDPDGEWIRTHIQTEF
ncbi:transport and Golgi organization protein 2 [Sitodiplosis mosellana]|uniref:transport and Golgi organization protein 2 n=1 Tax=Sitodiplosis mosellana TaxID=263140 RepID=UPI002444BC4F|nr:transport and Golgi organization protein 2 [Sitodiplosis mosellana]XP_055308590.1 transport and Golgi organization protein 2 [Sitodiplosis mosellana]